MNIFDRDCYRDRMEINCCISLNFVYIDCWVGGLFIVTLCTYISTLMCHCDTLRHCTSCTTLVFVYIVCLSLHINFNNNTICPWFREIWQSFWNESRLCRYFTSSFGEDYTSGTARTSLSIPLLHPPAYPFSPCPHTLSPPLPLFLSTLRARWGGTGTRRRPRQVGKHRNHPSSKTEDKCINLLRNCFGERLVKQRNTNMLQQ